jgi:hypothetical protein
MMAIQPMSDENGGGYQRVAGSFINHTLINKDDYVEKNLAEVHVYLESNSIQYINEEADYEFAQLFSDLGGVQRNVWEKRHRDCFQLF